MAGKLKHFQTLDGRHYTRIAIPEPLRSLFNGKRELRHAHGDSLRLAERDHYAIVADFHAQLDDAKARRSPIALTDGAIVRERAMSLSEFARAHYAGQLRFDQTLRDHAPAFARIGIDDLYVRALRSIKAGTAADDEIEEAIGHILADYRKKGRVELHAGSADWRAAARILAAVEYEALSRMSERDDGDDEGKASLSILSEPEPTEAPRPKGDALSILGLLSGYLKELAASGRGAEAERRWTPGFKTFVRFLGHDDARLVSKSDVVAWKDRLLETHAPKTVRDTNVAALRAVLQWAVDNDKLTSNPALGVKVRVTKKTLDRDKGFTLNEALAVLKAARDYAPAFSDNPATRESAQVTAAKRWTPWLCAFTGARISEMTQLRTQDIRSEDGVTYLHITPDAGSVKTGAFRDVPVHPQLVEMGFLDFVKSASPGPLFYNGTTARKGSRHASKYAAQRMATWVRSLGLIGDEIDPNHGWRHRFKTVTRDLAADPRVVDDIQGHAARTAGESYGSVSLKAKAAVINKLPSYEL